MKGITKRELLDVLEKKTLKKLAGAYELPVRANAGQATLIEAIASKRSIKIEEILPEMGFSELKAACDVKGLPITGKKQDLLKRLALTRDEAGKAKKKATTPKQAVRKPNLAANTEKAKPKTKSKRQKPTLCSSKPLKTSMTSSTKMQAAPVSWITPSNRHGCYSLNTLMTWSTQNRRKPSY